MSRKIGKIIDLRLSTSPLGDYILQERKEDIGLCGYVGYVEPVYPVYPPPRQGKQPHSLQSPREPQLVTMVSITPVQFAKTKATSYCDPEYQGRPWGV